jgi:hypothetical protein
MHNLAAPGVDQNDLIAALNTSDRNLLQSQARVVRLRSGAVLYEPGDMVSAAYFPLVEAVATSHVIMEDGSAIEITMIGREGAIGGIVSSGRLASYGRASVMHGGHFARIDSAALENLKTSSPAIRDLLNRYADCLLAQIFQSVGCNAVHDLEQRAAKWLTSAVDRTGTSHVVMTQEQFGSLLGIARSYASRLIQHFRVDGLVETRRGALVVTNVEELRKRACGCNELVQAHYDRVLTGVYPGDAASAQGGRP